MKSVKKTIKSPRQQEKGKMQLGKILGTTAVLAALTIAGIDFAGSGTKNQIGDPAPTQIVTPTAEPSLLDQVNAVRAKAGKPALVESAELDVAAQKKVDDQVARNYWDHHLPGENTFQFFPAAVHPYPLAENLAKCQKSDTQVVGDWVASPGHYSAMVGDYNQIGFAQEKNPRDSNCLYTVAEFRKFY